ncbi:uncharacterized protein LOC101848079 [Aplysia californica]|uniref:Uncharacterized protein LOC101848079 n=1 Tax=Aplysia californica TaxID=6500 RepID=A0ABM0K659_APLCA|nr:uncharacterized protein LOC101848079 [Aplysia californica]
MDERPLIEGAHLSDSDSSFESLPAVRRGGGEMGMTQRGGEMGMKHRGAENGVTQIVGDAESNLTENGGLHKQVTDSEQKVTYTIQEAIDHMGFGRYQVMIFY